MRSSLIRWGQGFAQSVVNSLHRAVRDVEIPAKRAKRAVACLLWISDLPMAEIETILTRHYGKFDAAAGPTRGAALRTGDMLPTVARVATILHPDLDLGPRLSRLVTRLEVGVPATVVEIAQFAGPSISRGDYHQLIKAELGTAAAVQEATDKQLAACLGGSTDRVELVRAAARMFHDQDDGVAIPALPQYEG